jgi:hypothetical protein
MQQLLLELAMTSNGSSLNYAGSSSGGHAQPIPMLGLFDAPHLYFAAEWERATSDEERAIVVQRARDALQEIRCAPEPAPLVAESAEELERRIVRYGVGLTPREVTLSAKCTATFVRAARVRAGRDPERGRLLRRWKDMTAPERQETLEQLRAEGMSGRTIAESLHTSYSTIARALGWKQ